MTADLEKNFHLALEKSQNLQMLEELRVRYLGKQGMITEALKSLGAMDPETRKQRGAELNRLRALCQEALSVQKEKLEEQALTLKLASEKVDLTLPTLALQKGTHHLITQTTEEIVRYFERFGFKVEEGPDIETEEHNFNALNIPPHHPARQNHDTFYVDAAAEPLLLRTHTSTVQIRTFKKGELPLRVLAPGRVYRADYDATHLPMFHQIEGFIVEEGIHLGHLKSTLIDFCRAFFNKNDLKTRFRPSFFPFTEPSFEMDIFGNGRWLEVLGCGMIHPQVLRNVGLDPKKHQGFAFGMGVERFAMLKYEVNDIRNFVTGDVRWNRQMSVSRAFGT